MLRGSAAAEKDHRAQVGDRTGAVVALRQPRRSPPLISLISEADGGRGQRPRQNYRTIALLAATASGLTCPRTSWNPGRRESLMARPAGEQDDIVRALQRIADELGALRAMIEDPIPPRPKPPPESLRTQLQRNYPQQEKSVYGGYPPEEPDEGTTDPASP
jgi:hypothetical protein